MGIQKPNPHHRKTTQKTNSKTHHRQQVGFGVVDGGARGRLLDGGHCQRERELQGWVHGRGGAVDGEGLCWYGCVDGDWGKEEQRRNGGRK